MRHFLLITIVILATACSTSDSNKAAVMLQEIESLYEQGRYGDVLDSIVVLRSTYPTAIEERRAALTIWQNASLKLAQVDIAHTDSLLQETLGSIEREEGNLRKANMLRVRRDSLQARYEALCGVVRMIRMKQKEQ